MQMVPVPMQRSRLLSGFGMLVLIALLAVGCGGGDEQFIDTGGPVRVAFPTVEPTLHPLLEAMTPAQRELLKIDYLLRMRGLTKQSQNVVREMIVLTDYRDTPTGDGHPANLDWIVRVHDAADRSNSYLDYQSQVVLPEALSAYSDIHSVYLSALEAMAAGQVALLEATVILGPSGREYTDMGYVGKAEFSAVVGRAVFYLEIAENKLARVQERIGAERGRVRRR